MQSRTPSRCKPAAAERLADARSSDKPQRCAKRNEGQARSDRLSKVVRGILRAACGVLRAAHGILKVAHGILKVAHGILKVVHGVLEAARQEQKSVSASAEGPGSYKRKRTVGSRNSAVADPQYYCTSLTLLLHPNTTPPFTARKREHLV